MWDVRQMKCTSSVRCRTFKADAAIQDACYLGVARQRTSEPPRTARPILKASRRKDREAFTARSTVRIMYQRIGRANGALNLLGQSR